MAYQRIDIDEDECYEGWSYLNSDGIEEMVTLPSSGVGIVGIEIDDNCVDVYRKDIPKLIKALQAAYDYKE